MTSKNSLGKMNWCRQLLGGTKLQTIIIIITILIIIMMITTIMIIFQKRTMLGSAGILRIWFCRCNSLASQGHLLEKPTSTPLAVGISNKTTTIIVTIIIIAVATIINLTSFGRGCKFCSRICYFWCSQFWWYTGGLMVIMLQWKLATTNYD